MKTKKRSSLKIWGVFRTKVSEDQKKGLRRKLSAFSVGPNEDGDQAK